MSMITNHLKDLEINFNLDIAKELVIIFKSQFHDSIKDFQIYLECKNFEEASRLAHKMKSSAYNVGAKEMGLIYSKVESETVTNFTQENLRAIERLFDEFEKECQIWLSK